MLNDFFFLLLYCVLTFEPTIYLMQVYVRMYIEKKARRRRRRKKIEHKPRKMRPKQERKYITLSWSNIEHIRCGRRTLFRCTYIHTYSLSFSVIIIIIIELVQREKGVKLYVWGSRKELITQQLLCVLNIKEKNFFILIYWFKNDKYLRFTWNNF